MSMKCGICDRELGTVAVSEHHLIPKTFKGKETVPLHDICHSFIHSAISPREMVKHYHTIERLREHSAVKKFAEWVKNKPLDFYASSKQSNSQKKKR